MTPEHLKSSILQMAIEGKLVEQRPEEGSGRCLLEDIQTRRNKLIKDGVIKKIHIDDNILADETPFDIPSNWTWTKIGLLEEINLGFTYRPEYTEEGVYFLSVKDISSGHIDFSKAKKVSKKTYDNAAYGSKPSKGDILFGRVGTIGVPQIIDTEIDFCIFVSLGFFRDHLNCLNKKYIAYWMDSWLFKNQVDKKVKGSAQKNLNTNWLKNFFIPLPPLDEQDRIVAKLEGLMPLVDKYAVAYEKLEKLNSEFPEKLKKSILQYAIQGKLVEQRPEEGSAEDLYNQIQAEKEKLIASGKLKKQKHISPINYDELPFTIPNSWKWAKLADLLSLENGRKMEGKEYKYLQVKYLRGDIMAKIKSKGAYAKKGTRVILVDGENSGEVFTIQEDGYLGSTFKILLISQHIYDCYVLMFLELVREVLRNNKKGAAIPHLNKELFFNFLLPLPPLEEQKRIVTKIDECLLVINNIKG